VWGEVELAARFLVGTPIVAVTGTNGKSTTTALAGALFERDRRTFTGGNLGTPLCELVLSGERVDAVVLELSSFQIEGLQALRPRVAAILNVTPDHLDRYRDVEEYAAAKARLFGLQQPGDAAIANARDDRALAMTAAGRAERHTFGFGPPAAGGVRDAGGEAGPAGSEIVLLRGAGDAERYVVRNRALRGRHNRENAMAAVLSARLLGVPGAAVQAGLDAFPGLPHRLELVSERGGIEWVNDSKATNVDSTLVGLSAFAPAAPRVVLIMGGRGKGAPYASLRSLFEGRVKALLTIGEDAPRIESELGGACRTEGCGTLDEAVRRAAGIASPGEVVLLSPACASYDQFRNYEERGEAFRRHVMELAR
jgi:UDP-N-acetylmuramoylalanine--D-glutamate ligase